MAREAQTAERDMLSLAVVVLVLLGTVAGRLATSPYMTVDIAVACAAIAAVVAGFGVITRGAGPWSRAVLPGLLLVAWLGVVSLLSPRVPSALLGQSGSGVGLLLLVGLVLIAGFGRGSASAVVGWLRVLTPWLIAMQGGLVLVQALSGQVMRGTLPNSSYLAELIVLLLPFTFDPKKPRSAVGWAAAVAAGLVLAISGARVGFLVAALWLGIRAWKTRIGGSDAQTIAAIIGGLAATFGAGLLVSGADFSRWTPAALLGERPAIWATAVTAAMLRPLRGWGADGFGVGGSNAASTDLLDRGLVPVFGPLTNDPHNVLLWMLVSGGVIALALAVWLVAEVAMGGARSRDELDETLRSGRGDALAAVAMYGIVVLTQPIVPQTLPLFALVLGLALVPTAAGQKRSDAAENAAGRMRWVAVAGVLAAVVLAGSAATRVIADSAGPENAVARAQRSQRIADVVRIDPHLYYQSSLQWAYAVQANPTLSDTRPDAAALDRATALDPRYYLYVLEQGRAGVFYRDPAAQVIAVYEEVLDLYETSPEANARLAREHAVAGDATLAEEYLGVVIVQSPLDAGTLDLVAEAFAYLGDEESAAQYRKAAEDARALAR